MYIHVHEVRILPDPVSLSDFHAFVSLALPAQPAVGCCISNMLAISALSANSVK